MPYNTCAYVARFDRVVVLAMSTAGYVVCGVGCEFVFRYFFYYQFKIEWQRKTELLSNIWNRLGSTSTFCCMFVPSLNAKACASQGKHVTPRHAFSPVTLVFLLAVWTDHGSFRKKGSLLRTLLVRSFCFFSCRVSEENMMGQHQGQQNTRIKKKNRTK